MPNGSHSQPITLLAASLSLDCQAHCRDALGNVVCHVGSQGVHAKHQVRVINYSGFPVKFESKTKILDPALEFVNQLPRDEWATPPNIVPRKGKGSGTASVDGPEFLMQHGTTQTVDVRTEFVVARKAQNPQPQGQVVCTLRLHY